MRAFYPALPGLKSFILFFLLSLFIAVLPEAQANPDPPAGMVYVPEGYFPMGTNSGRDDEGPLHFVNTSAYFIGKYEVSNREYQTFLQATGHEPPKYMADENFNADDQPVVGVSWHDAMAYASWKGGRLPTEAEWEKAARGNDSRMWPWGEKFAGGFFNHFANIYGEDDNYLHTAPVTYYEPGKSPFGLYNTAGNVWEWCLDRYDQNYYRKSREFDPQGPDGPMTDRVLRGGSWVNSLDGVKVVKRAHNDPNVKNRIYGFRIVIPIP